MEGHYRRYIGYTISLTRMKLYVGLAPNRRGKEIPMLRTGTVYGTAIEAPDEVPIILLKTDE